MPYLAATSLVLSRSRLMSDTTSTPSMFRMPSRCLMPNAPAPARATLMLMFLSSCVLKNQVAHRRVAGGHMVEAVRDPGCGPGHLAINHIAHRTARDQPHHQLDALAAGFAHVVDVWHLGAGGGVGNHLIQPGVVPLAVDQAG